MSPWILSPGPSAGWAIGAERGQQCKLGWKPGLATVLSPEAHTILLWCSEYHQESRRFGKQLIHSDKWIKMVNLFSSGSVCVLGQGQEKKEPTVPRSLTSQGNQLPCSPQAEWMTGAHRVDPIDLGPFCQHASHNNKFANEQQWEF